MAPSTPDALDSLNARRSTPSRLLGEPGPDDTQFWAMLSAAVRVPDHGKLTPWRLLRIGGAQRARLGDLLVRRQLERDPQTPAAVLEKDRQRFNHAPLVLAVISTPIAGHKVPLQEQLLSAGNVCFALLHAATALGFGAQWLTGWAAYDESICTQLGLAGHEGIVGFVHIGTPQDSVPERVRPDPRELLTDWEG
jgi:nitroreductase